MRNVFIFLLIISSLICLGQLPIVSSGTIQRFEKFPSKYVDSRNIDVWLPDGYSTDNKYTVLYMHDGQMLFDSTITWNGQEWRVDETISRLIYEGKIRNCIVVGIWNNGDYRRSEYLPQKALEYMPDYLADSIVNGILMGKARADNYLQFLVEELKPFIDTTFSTYSDKPHTFIMGSSMGGLISLYAICEYPDIFGGAACMSTHWYGDPVSWNKIVPEAYNQYLAENLPDPISHKLYFDHGTETLDLYYDLFQKETDEVILYSGYDSSNFKTLTFSGHAHKENAWADRLKIPIMFLLGKEK